MIYAIVHADRAWGIGKEGGMMFSLPKDMRFFRETTTGHVVVAGGKTLRSFPGQKPLKNRVNIVLTRGQVCDECIAVHSFDELKAELKRRENEEIFIVGGGEIYREMLPYCHGAYVTKVDALGGADVFFPNLDEDPSFRVAEESEPIEDNGFAIRFVRYENLEVKTL